MTPRVGRSSQFKVNVSLTPTPQSICMSSLAFLGQPAPSVPIQQATGKGIGGGGGHALPSRIPPVAITHVPRALADRHQGLDLEWVQATRGMGRPRLGALTSMCAA